MSKSIGGLVLGFLAITAAAVPARADLFDVTASIQTFTVATTGVYTITSAGAQGGPGESDSGGLAGFFAGSRTRLRAAARLSRHRHRLHVAAKGV